MGSYLERSFRPALKAMQVFVNNYSAAQLMDRKPYGNIEVPGFLDSAVGGLFKLVDFRMTPTLFGLFLVSCLAASSFLSTGRSREIRNWAISGIPLFFTGLVIQFLGSMLLLTWGGFELYFSFSLLWFGADTFHTIVPLASVFLAFVLWYVLKRNHYVVYRRVDAQTWILVKCLLLPSVFVLQPVRNICSIISKLFSWIGLDRSFAWVFDLPVIGVIRDFIVTPPYMSLVGNFDSVILSVCLCIVVNNVFPVLIKRIIKFVYRYFKIKVDEVSHHNGGAPHSVKVPFRLKHG